MTDQIWTYRSLNAPEDKQWLAFLAFNGSRLPIACHGPTEEIVKQKARDVYAIDKEKRDANRAKRAATKAKEKDIA